MKEQDRIRVAPNCRKVNGNGVGCWEQSGCNECGWNPSVARRRIERVRNDRKTMVRTGKKSR